MRTPAPAEIARPKLADRFDPWEAAADGVALLVLLWPIRELQADGGGIAGIVFIALSVVVLVVRRRWPLPTMVTALLLALVGPLLASVLSVWVAAHVCLFSLALRRPLRLAVLSAAALFAVTFVGVVGQLDSSVFDLRVLGLLAWTASVTATGAAVRSQRGYVAAIEDRAARLQQTRESEVRHKVTEERLRIARDLHDAVAHSITVISLHAGSAQSTLGRSEEATRTSLAHIHAAARGVLAEMQEILQVLRTEGNESERPAWVQISSGGPVVGLRGVLDLVESFRATGLSIDLCDRTNDAPLGPVGDAAIYRVAQEALTNARKHGVGVVRLEINECEGATELRVTNDRVGAHEFNRATRESAGDAPTSGFGLVGMRERVSQARGNLELIETATSFTLVVSLPHASTTSPDYASPYQVPDPREPQ
ncbi:hypothetical protein GCM10023350_24860 [Nocardioides endophyticus]|uniref:histidine kinase n=1 Tax=Nocardioides endophyticus TaxID=1353775 RepID=A0ABP8YZC2_9ACTN